MYNLVQYTSGHWHRLGYPLGAFWIQVWGVSGTHMGHYRSRYGHRLVPIWVIFHELDLRVLGTVPRRGLEVVLTDWPSMIAAWALGLDPMVCAVRSGVQH